MKPVRESPAAKSARRLFRVWTGTTYEDSWATSAKKAVANVEWRMRKRGKFPLRSQFTVEEVSNGK